MSDAIEVRVPDIGDFEDVEVVEVLVSAGDRVEAEDSVVSIESDKATMEIPAPVAGVVGTVHVALGDRVSEGSLLLELVPLEEARADSAGAKDGAASEAASQAASGAADESVPAAPTARPDPAATPAPMGSGSEQAVPAESQPTPVAPARQPGEAPPRRPPVPDAPFARADEPHASPLVRRFARELGVDLHGPEGSGPQGRVLESDIKRFVQDRMRGPGPVSPATGEDAVPEIDFSRFGPVREVALGKIRRVSARNLSRSWRVAPHVTQHDEADLTELEAFRKSLSADAKSRGLKLSPLHFVMKAVASALRDFPDLRSSLAADGEKLLVKDYYHLGVAVDSDHGLVVPVVRDVDRKGVFALAEELAGLAERARARKLSPADMQGATFTISSLGGIGGTAFSPIVNVPEVAILGLSKLSVRPTWTAGLDVHAAEGRFEPRIVLPLSLSYDHRVIDGAVAVRFTTHLVRLLSHPAYLLL